MVEGDCRERLLKLDDASVDAVVTDPPYGIDFMNKSWDGRDIRAAARSSCGVRLLRGEAFQAWSTGWAAECARVLKPGGHLFAFGAPRTVHRLASGIEDAGLELRDTLMWLYGTGMAKSPKLPGGRGTNLKPAYEPIVLCRKAPDSTVRDNVKRHGTGALNVDACRVNGRYPANVLVSHSTRCTARRCTPSCAVSLVDDAAERGRTTPNPQLRASRIFYCPKATRREREAGCERLHRETFDVFPNARRGGHAPAAANRHPTVKPLALMRWLVELGCPAGGLVLDPFCGSGSTGAAAVATGRTFVGIERDPDYAKVARARIAYWARSKPPPPTRPSGLEFQAEWS